MPPERIAQTARQAEELGFGELWFSEDCFFAGAFAGIAVSRFDDVAGLAVLRVVATLANEAADAVTHGVASATDVDVAMQKGVNYPRGPLRWADEVGVGRIRDVLHNLAAHYGEDRYRLAPLIARRYATGERLAAGPSAR